MRFDMIKPFAIGPFAIGMCVFLVFQNLAQGQAGSQGGLNIVEVEGKVLGVDPSGLRIEQEDGTLATIMTGAVKELEYSAEASLQFISPGLFVRFQAPFDASGMPTEAVTKLTIFVPQRAMRMSDEELMLQTPGVYPAPKEGKKTDAKESGAANQRKTSDASKNARNRAGNNQPGRAQAGATGGDFLVVGRIAAVQGDKMRLIAGRLPVMVQVDESAKIEVQSHDLSFCQPGDTAKVTGLANADAPNMIKATSLTVAASAKLGETTGDLRKDLEKKGPGRKDPASPNDNNRNTRPKRP